MPSGSVLERLAWLVARHDVRTLTMQWDGHEFAVTMLVADNTRLPYQVWQVDESGATLLEAARLAIARLERHWEELANRPKRAAVEYNDAGNAEQFVAETSYKDTDGEPEDTKSKSKRRGRYK